MFPRVLSYHCFGDRRNSDHCHHLHVCFDGHFSGELRWFQRQLSSFVPEKELCPLQ